METGNWGTAVRNPERDIEEMARQRRKIMERLSFFDANVWLGRPGGFPLAREVEAGAIEGLLTHYSITGCLVSHWHSRTLSAQDGNRALEEALPALPASCGAIWTGLPLLPGEAGPIPGLGPLSKRVSGVRIFPKTHRFPLTPWAVGSLCRWLSERHLPLFLWHAEMEWPALYALAKAFPGIAIVVESQPQKILYHVRSLFALMGECPNVFVETSNFVGQGIVEYTVRNFGVHRLIFGTFLPAGDPLVPIGMLVDADITEDEKVMIAGGNLRRLMCGVKQ